MKKTFLIIALILFTSCEGIKKEKEYNALSWELKKKEAELRQKHLELDYLERLYDLRDDIEHEERRKKIDSLLNNLNHQTDES